MKIIALTSQHPGLRYCAQLTALKQAGVELECVSLDSGKALLIEKCKQHLKILRRRGLRSYLERRREGRAAAPERREVSLLISQLSDQFEWKNSSHQISRSFNGFSNQLLQFLNSSKPDFVFQLGVGIIPAGFIERAPPILNLHPGILPGIRGVDPIFWVHYYGREDWCGTTLHLIDRGIDTGKPLIRRKFTPLKDKHYAHTIIQQIQIEIELLKLFVRDWPHNLSQHDQGGSDTSIYRSSWTKSQYERLKQAQWWGAEKLPQNLP